MKHRVYRPSLSVTMANS